MNLSFFVLALFLIFGFVGCAGKQAIYQGQSDHDTHEVYEVSLTTLRFRDQTGFAASKDEYEVKNQGFSCSSPKDFIQEWAADLEKKIECLNSQKGSILQYAFIGGDRLRLELDPFQKNIPECIQKFFSVIPLPREVYFLGRDHRDLHQADRLECYAMSFSTDPNYILDAVSRRPRFYFQIEFEGSLDRSLLSERDFVLWYHQLVYRLFRDPSSPQRIRFRPKVVSELLCQSCFKGDERFELKRSFEIDPVLWP